MEGPVAVVGGSGKLAGCCIRLLLSKNRHVVAVGRDTDKLKEMHGSSPLLSCVSADVCQPETLNNAFQGSHQGPLEGCVLHRISFAAFNPPGTSHTEWNLCVPT